MSFKIDEKVSFLYETGWGRIKEFRANNLVLIQDETGFDRLIPFNELVKIYGDQRQGMEQVNSIVAEKDLENNSTTSKVDDTKKNKDFWELDLHIHELIETERGLSNADMLRHQMQVFKNFFRKAKDERVRKLVVIHGVGKGVLKEEVRSFLSTQDGVEYFDADFREYGKGATEVQLLYR
jgi:hypothetical protein